MFRKYLIILLIFITISAKSTNQVPDILIVACDTFYIDKFILEKNNSINLLEAAYGMEAAYGIENCMGSACWRGYQAEWIIVDNKLYLNNIYSCCRFAWKSFHEFNDSIFNILKLQGIPEKYLQKLETLTNEVVSDEQIKRELTQAFRPNDLKLYLRKILSVSEIPRTRANLHEIFGDKVDSGRVWASWYSDKIIIPKGKIIEYHEFGISKYEEELYLEFKNGILIDSINHKYKPEKVKNEFGWLTSDYYVMVIPKSLIHDKFGYEKRDKFAYTDVSGNIEFTGFLKHFKNEIDFTKRNDVVVNSIDSLIKTNSNEYIYDKSKIEKYRWGTRSWADGTNNQNNSFIRVFSVLYNNRLLLMIYKEKNINKKNFIKKTDYIINSIRMTDD